MERVKAFFIMAFSAFCSVLGTMAFPVIALVVLNLIDYGTGIGAANRRGEDVSSYKSIWGVIKKVCMWLLIVVGWIMDLMLRYTVSTVGLPFEMPYIVAIVVTVWLIFNEIISILENIIDIGMEKYIPPFMLPLARMIRKQMEDKMRIEEEEETDDE